VTYTLGVRKASLRIVAGLILLIASAPAQSARADGITDQAAKISEQSFAILSALNAQSGGASANPLLGPVASLSGDAETLKKALASGDESGASSALQSLLGDRAAIDDALKTNPKAIKAEDWNAIKVELDQIAPQVAKLSPANPSAPAVPPSAASVAPIAAVPPAVASAPVASSAPPPAMAPASSAPVSADASSSPPSVTIESRTLDGGVVHIKGSIQGRGLKTAGIYEGDRCVKSFKVGGVPGEQRVELDIGIGNPPSGTEIRVTDAAGRTASASVVDATAMPGPSEANAEPLPPSAPPSGPIALGSREGGVDVYRNSTDDGGSEGSSSGTVKEIPSHGLPSPMNPSPSRRHTMDSKLDDVVVNVIDVTQSESNPHSFEVVGQIVGSGVTRAGIYVDGRLVHTIPVQSGSTLQSFDETFISQGGVATVRAYGAGDRYVESSLDDAEMQTARLPSDLGSTVPGVPMGPRSAQGIGVMITGVQPIGGNLYQVTGTISGRNIASAGLYQNGVLAQSIGPGTSGLSTNLKGGLGGSLGSMLGSLIPGMGQSYNFSVRYNPGAGFATIRAYDQTGAFTEQPIASGGVNPYGGGINPYSGANPYGGGMPGYGTAPANPYANRRPSTGTTIPLW